MDDLVAKNIDGKPDTQNDVAQGGFCGPYIAPLSVLRGLRRTHALRGWF